MKYKISKKDNLYHPCVSNKTPNPNLTIWSGIPFSWFKMEDKITTSGTVTRINTIAEFDTLEEAKAKMYEFGFTPFIVVDTLSNN